MEKVYACIDFKAFYASVEAVERGLNPLQCKLVVADASRGKGAITLSVTPSLKAQGIKSRGRLYEIPKNVEYELVRPQIKLYMTYSARIYAIYLRFFAAEDIYVYSIDESFFDLTPYLRFYKKSATEIVKMVIETVVAETGIYASAGIGPNLFLAKVALDILAKKAADFIGVLDEHSFERFIASHRPITDIWGIGHGIAARLNKLHIYDLKGIQLVDFNDLKKCFGVNANILYDHAFGKESSTLADIKAYRPKSQSLSMSQILFEDYDANHAWIVLLEMIEQLALELTEKMLRTKWLSLRIGYSKDVLPASSGSMKLEVATNLYSELKKQFTYLYQTSLKKGVPIRQLAIAAGHLTGKSGQQIDLFNDPQKQIKEEKLQQALSRIKQKYGKNSVMRGISYLPQATGRERNKMIGGHYAGE